MLYGIDLTLYHRRSAKKLPCETMVSIIPERLRDSEKDQTLSEWDWEKLLLERLLLRKELRLKSMQDKLNEQQKCIEEKEDKIKLLSEDLEETAGRNENMKTTIEKHTNLPGFNVYLGFNNIAAFLISRINIFTSWISLLFNIMIQVIVY